MLRVGNRVGTTMMLSSYSDVFSINHDRQHDEDIRPGDVVRTGENHFPHFEVLAIHGDKAWVRNISNGLDSLALVSRCRQVPAHSMLAAE